MEASQSSLLCSGHVQCVRQCIVYASLSMCHVVGWTSPPTACAMRVWGAVYMWPPESSVPKAHDFEYVHVSAAAHVLATLSQMCKVLVRPSLARSYV